MEIPLSPKGISRLVRLKSVLVESDPEGIYV